VKIQKRHDLVKVWEGGGDTLAISNMEEGQVKKN